MKGNQHECQETSQAPTQNQKATAAAHAAALAVWQAGVPLPQGCSPSLVTGRCRCPACRTVHQWELRR